MNAPTPNGSLDPNNATPQEEQLDLPGIAAPGAIAPKASAAAPIPPVAESQEEKDKRKAAESKLHAAQFLSVQQLLEEIKTVKPETTPAQLSAIENFFKSLDQGSQGSFVIPKVSEGSPIKNTHLALAISTSLKPQSLDANKIVFQTAAGNGTISSGQEGIFFNADIDATTKKAKPFGVAEARQIAILAMHNKDLLPPNAIALTGTPEERNMIKAEIEQLNQILPPHARFIFDDELSAPASAPHKASLTEVVGGKMGKGFEDLKRRLRLGGKPADEAQDAAPETTTPPQGDVLELSKTDIAPETPAEVQSTVKTHAAETPEAQVERAALEEVLNQFPQAILKNSEKVTEIDSQDVYKARIQEPSSDLSNMKDVLFIQNDEKLKIIAVEGDGNFERLLTKPETQKPASELGEGFKPAAEGVSEDHADFIGPPRPPASPRASGEQPTPPAA